MNLNRFFKRFFATAIIMYVTAVGSSAQTVEFLDGNHCMVRVEATAKYILLPVEEKTETSHIRLIENGSEVKSLNVRLAVDNIDYYVPLDISAYKGRKIVLDIHVNGDKRAMGEIRGFACWSKLLLSDTFDTANSEKLRPLYHHTPAYGWMNDPNGLFYNNGVWHLYYQHNPYGSQWENMHWGHSTSTDLVHWTQHGDAVSPDALGAVFSGCCVVDKQNTSGYGANAIVGLYTSAAENQTQSLMASADGGMTFTKYEGNPVITSNVPDFRDPHVFWNKHIGKWNLILAAGQEMRIYTSADLKAWRYESSFGQGYGCHDGVWECPDLVELPIEGTNETRWMLICNINPGGPFGGSATQYFVGQFDGRTFTCDSKPSVTKWLDYGKDHYAAVTFDNAPDNRHVLIGWMSNWQYANQVPTKQYRSANTIARDLQLFRDGTELYASVKPSKENDEARGAATVKRSKSSTVALGKAAGACEMVIDLVGNAKGETTFTLSNSKGEKVVMAYDAAAETFGMDRNQSGDSSFSDAFKTVTIAPTHGKVNQLRMFIDKSSIEVFDAQGRMAMTNIVFPSEDYNRLTIGGKNRQHTSVTVYPIK